MNVYVVQLDGKWPNHALARVMAHHRERKDAIRFEYVPGMGAFDRGMWPEVKPDRVYASLIFESTRPLAERLLTIYPDALVGGTGWDFVDGKQVSLTLLEENGVTTPRLDYTAWPDYTASLGFTQRGCRLRCPFCRVPKMEPELKAAQSIRDIWRGDPWPRHIALLDNDFFGQEGWRDRVTELAEGRFRVCFTQGINVRAIGDEEAEALAALDTYDDKFDERALYCAWDNAKEEASVFEGLARLERAGVKPGHVCCYVLVGYWHRRIVDADVFRVQRLREFGAFPFPMPYRRPIPQHKPGCPCEPCDVGRELVGFTRWALSSSDKSVSWPEFKAARCQPRNVHRIREANETPLFPGAAT